MKKTFYLIIMAVVLTIVTSCAKNEECVCENTASITEEDAKDYGVTLNEACNLAKFSDSSCTIK